MANDLAMLGWGYSMASVHDPETGPGRSNEDHVFSRKDMQSPLLSHLVLDKLDGKPERLRHLSLWRRFLQMPSGFYESF